MKSNHVNRTISGKRIKDLAKAHGYTRKKMAVLLNYGCAGECNYISYIYKGTRTLSDDRFLVLVDEFKVREEYLRGLDDFRTEEEMLNHIETIDKEGFSACRAYLETLGLKLKPKLCSLLRITNIYRHKDVLFECFSDETINTINACYDFTLESKDFYKKYFSDLVSVEWKKTIDELPISLEDLDNAGKQSHVPDLVVYHDNDNPDNNLSFDYELMFVVYHNDCCLGDFNLEEIQTFMNRLDSFAKCCIDTLLPSKKGVKNGV